MGVSSKLHEKLDSQTRVDLTCNVTRQVCRGGFALRHQVKHKSDRQPLSARTAQLKHTGEAKQQVDARLLPKPEVPRATAVCVNDVNTKPNMWHTEEFTGSERYHCGYFH